MPTPSRPWSAQSCRQVSSYVALAFAVSCGGGSATPPDGGPAMAMKVVGPSGGAVASSDGNLALAIPSGAVAADVTVTVAPVEAPAAGAVGEVYEIGPTGTQFAMPVTLTLKYGSVNLGSTPPSSLRVATFAGGAWQLLPGTVVDTSAKTVSGLTTHLSPYAIVAESSGKTCATVKAAQACSTSAGPAGGDTSGGAMCQPGPTCAAASNVCAGYPGATMDSCMDAATGYVATCCFPSDAPVCFAAAAGAGCTDPAGGAGGGSCPPPPTCATAAGACGGYPGATLQNCTNTTTGFTGACCFDAQSPVCISVAAGRGCTAPAGGGTGSCPPAPKCADSNPCAPYPGATMQSCADGTDGFKATCCFPLGTLPTAPSGSSGGGTPVADGGVAPTVDAGIGGGGDGGGTDPGGGQCVAGASCQNGSPECKNASPTTCSTCSCSNGKLECRPCSVAPDGGQPPPPDGGGAISPCVAGGTCNPGEKCGMGGPAGCMECACDPSGKFVCGPCPPPPDGGVPPPPDGGPVSACMPDGMCRPGEKCGMGGPSGCVECTCSASGTFACGPCPPPPDGGVPPPPDGGAAPGCQVFPMPPPQQGASCGATANCSDGRSYKAQCDGATGKCMCFIDGAPTPMMPTVPCTPYDALAELKACGFAI